MTFKQRKENYFFDHPHLKNSVYETKGLFLSLLSAFLFAFGFISFISPATSDGVRIISGGVSGLSQNIAVIINLIFKYNIPSQALEAISYIVFNLPLLIFAYLKIGKRFAILTMVNVAFSSLFIYLLPYWDVCKNVASNEFVSNNVLLRAAFAGFCTGVSSAIAFRGEISCGGIDILTYYLSARKSTSVGKYSIAINSFITLLYSILIIIQDQRKIPEAILSVFLSVTYLVVANVIVDLINLRNKKVQLEFFTTREDLPKVLMAQFPHGATIVKGKGAYSGSNRTVVYMVVSSFEMNRVVALAKKADPSVFISAISLIQIYGNFFIKTVE